MFILFIDISTISTLNCLDHVKCLEVLYIICNLFIEYITRDLLQTRPIFQAQKRKYFERIIINLFSILVIIKTTF